MNILKREENRGSHLCRTLAFFLMACLGLLPLQSHADNINMPVLYESYYLGFFNEKPVQLHLYHTRDAVVKGYYISEFYKNRRRLKGTINGNTYHLEPVYGSWKESFDLVYESDVMRTKLEGTWTRNEVTTPIRFSIQGTQMLISPDINHMFIGEWIPKKSPFDLRSLKLSLYNGDLEGDAVLIADLGLGYNTTRYTAQKQHVKLLTKDRAIIRHPNFTVDLQLKLKEGHLEMKWGNSKTFYLIPQQEDLEKYALDRNRDSIQNAPYMWEEMREKRLDEEGKNQRKVTPKPAADASRPSPKNADALTLEMPAIEDEETVDASVTDEALSIEDLHEEQQEEIYDNKTLEVPAEFPGGEFALSRQLSKLIVYPKEAQKKGYSGLVLVRFSVEKDGSVGTTEIVRSTGHACLEKAATDAVKALPRFTPARQKGKPVRVYYTIPINFQ